MKVLLGNNHLHQMGGTETYVYTLASSLLKLGHEVEIILGDPTLQGIMSSKIEGELGIKVDYLTGDYDVVLLNHKTTLQRFFDLNLSYKSKVFQIIHGLYNEAEHPYLGKEIEYITISEEVHDGIKKSYNKESIVIRNLIDLDLYNPTPTNPTLKSIYSLSQNDDMNNLLRTICDELGLDFSSNNKHSNPTSSVREKIENADLVISLGRGCYEAMAMGKNVLVADMRRDYMPDFTDGMVNNTSFLNYIKCNCSGRYLKNPTTYEILKNEIQKYDPLQGSKNSELVNLHFNAQTLTKKLLSLFPTEPNKKKIALVSTFCDTQIKQDTLKHNILKIKNLGIDVMVISPIYIPKDITDLCDYYFQTKDNPMLEWPVRAYTHWYKHFHPDGRILEIHRGLADYGWAALYQVKKLSQLALTFDYDMFYHIIYDLEIDNVIEQEFLANKNIVHPRRNPKNLNEIWETNLHFVALNRELMEKIEKDITLNEYLRDNGIAEGEVQKWVDKYNIPISKHFVKDTIFYWDDFDFFDYQIFPEFKMFISKNEPTSNLVGNPPTKTPHTDNLRIVFHGIENNPMGEVKITINGVEYIETPKNFEFIEFPISSQNIDKLTFEHNSKIIDFTKTYLGIMRNIVYYNKL